MGILSNFISKTRIEKPGITKKAFSPSSTDDSISQPSIGYTGADTSRMGKPEYNIELISIIRKLVLMNPDFSQALETSVRLSNTGLDISFDNTTTPEYLNQMRKHINEVSRLWIDGGAGLHTLSSKFFRQCYIAGAICYEVIPKTDLSGVDFVRLIRPETIRFFMNDQTGRWEAYQKNPSIVKINQYVKMNPATFRYVAINGDTSLPYGYSPYISALQAVDTQIFMTDSMKNIMENWGILGVAFMKIAKPNPEDLDGSDNMAKIQLKRMLKEEASSLKDGLKNNMVIGFEDDHDLEFISPIEKGQNADKLFNLNEQQVMSGLKLDPSFFGRSFNTSETQISIIFLKLLSELKDVHFICSFAMEHIIGLELLMSNYKYGQLKCSYRTSTIADELKHQQSEEIKIRNVNSKYQMGIISIDSAADELNYEKADQRKPREPIDLAGNAQAKTNRKQDKTSSEKKVREKNKPVPRMK